jgi:hypothetical protein
VATFQEVSSHTLCLYFCFSCTHAKYSARRYLLDLITNIATISRSLVLLQERTRISVCLLWYIHGASLSPSLLLYARLNVNGAERSGRHLSLYRRNHIREWERESGHDQFLKREGHDHMHNRPMNLRYHLTA